jgi:hypothetical protein
MYSPFLALGFPRKSAREGKSFFPPVWILLLHSASGLEMVWRAVLAPA